jgi:hypothetical protein
MTTKELEALRDRILAMPPADQLRVAAGLIDKGKSDLAEPIVRNIADELTALRMFGQLKADRAGR